MMSIPGDSDEACSICFETMNNVDERIVLCSNEHRFHVSCVNTWFGASKKTCPFCRVTVSRCVQDYVSLCTHVGAYKGNGNAFGEWRIDLLSSDRMLKLLLCACRQGHSQNISDGIACALIDAESVNQCGCDRIEETLEMRSLRSKHAASAIRSLCRQRPPGSVNRVTPQGQTILLRAIDVGRADVVDVLINELGADPFQPVSALAFATVRNRPDCLRVLSRHEAVDVDARYGDKRMTALMMACQHGFDECIDVLLFEADAGLDTVVDSKGWTALFYAAAAGRDDIVRLIALDYDAEVNLGDRILRTPLMIAASRGHEEVVKILLDLGADAHFETPYGQTALFESIAGGSVPCLRLLLSMGVDVNVQGSAGPRFGDKNDSYTLDTPLTAAIDEGFGMVEALLEANADVDGIDGIGRTALMKAAKSSDLETVRLLVERGADVTKKDPTGRTARDLSHLPRSLTDLFFPEQPRKRTRSL